MKPLIKKRLPELLIEKGYVSPLEMVDCLRDQRVTGENLTKVLVNHGCITEEEISSVISEYLNIPMIHVGHYKIPSEVLAEVPESLAIQHTILPITTDGDTLTLAMSNPLNIIALDDVRMSTSYEIKRVIAPETEIKKAIEENYVKNKTTLDNLKFYDDNQPEADDDQDDTVQNSVPGLISNLPLDEQLLIKEVVLAFNTIRKLFTSVDVANEVKRTKFIRNRTVAEFLRDNCLNLTARYVITPINVSNGRTANLYHPFERKPEDYVHRDQEATTLLTSVNAAIPGDGTTPDTFATIMVGDYSTPYQRVQTEIQDQYGTLIQKGSVITYPVRKGSDMWMRTAVVESIGERNRSRTIKAIGINQDGSTRGVSINPSSDHRITVMVANPFPITRDVEYDAVEAILNLLTEDDD